MTIRKEATAAVAALLLTATAAHAATIRGTVADQSGAVVAAAQVVVRATATNESRTVETDGMGRFSVEVAEAGTYLVIVTHVGFSEVARTILVENATDVAEVTVGLDVGALTSQVSVTAARAERETRRIPLHVESIGRGAIEQGNPLSSGDALATVANITPVGNGPFGVRPRLRGLDSTRLLVLVDGERLNTARQATDRTGAEVGLIAPDAVSRLEIVNGAGTLLYGSDALAGTINIITNEPALTSDTRWLYGFNGLYSSNENGRRGTGTVGFTSPRVSVRLQAGAEAFDDYRAGQFDVEDTRPFFASGDLRRVDTIDDNFGFAFKAFPDPFNAPFVRTSQDIPSSGAEGHFVNLSSIVALGERRSLRLRYQRRQMDNIGFPDFAEPYFFNATSLPHSNLDRFSAKYEARSVTPWLANLSLTAHYQRTERLLKNLLPVQFPAPTPVAFFPISVFRLDITSETEQRVWTPGVDLLAVFVPSSAHVLTTGVTFYRDRSSDVRTTSTSTSLVGQVAVGARGPAPVVFPSPVRLGPPVVARPSRVPNASLRDVAVFAQDEWRVAPMLSLVAGLRGDFYRVVTEATPGYDVASVVAGARPAIDPATLPNTAGDRIGRKALTGDIGLVANSGGRVSPFVRFGRSYRHPNLEELLYSGPATAGNIAPNITVRPERGNNLDFGATFAVGRVTGGAYGFVNRYQDFVAQDLVVATLPGNVGLAQATNYADVRIGGVELNAEVPFSTRHGIITLSASGALTHGTITDGVNPLTKASLDGAPADNITPSKWLAAARFTEPRGRWWAEYGVRTQGVVTRITPTLLDSPFKIAQDLLSLDGFTVQRLTWGLSLSRRRDRLGLTVALENLGDVYYREHFQFAPSRGRSLTVGLTAGAF